MNFDYQLLFFFSALGAFNSSILSLYFFFFAKPKHQSNLFLGALLAVMSIRIWKSLFYFFNPELAKIFLQIGLSACFFIGPFLYFYIQSRIVHPDKLLRKWLIHLGLLIILTSIVGFWYPYQDNTMLWRKYIIKGINYQWLLYLVLAGISLKGVFKKLITNRSLLSYNETWALSIYFGVFIVWLAYYTTYYTSYIVGALSFSVVLYFSIFLIFSQRMKKKKESKIKYANTKISKEEANSLTTKIDHLIQEKELYKNPNLTLPKLSKELKLSQHLLSQLLNDNLNKNFSQFINEYRINAAIEILKSESNLKMEVIAEQCGFNSNSTFYTAFKKITNTTPSKYLSDN